MYSATKYKIRKATLLVNKDVFNICLKQDTILNRYEFIYISLYKHTETILTLLRIVSVFIRYLFEFLKNQLLFILMVLVTLFLYSRSMDYSLHHNAFLTLNY